MTGTIKRVVVDEDYGFIRGDVDGLEYFFHRTSVQGDIFERLSEGQAVEFDPSQGKKGPRAENVRLW